MHSLCPRCATLGPMPAREPAREQPQEQMRKLTIEIPRKMLKALRLAAIQEDTTVRALVTKLIERHLGRKSGD